MPSTKWGAERAKNGHPTPFPLQYVEIGNEDWFDQVGQLRWALCAVPQSDQGEVSQAAVDCDRRR